MPAVGRLWPSDDDDDDDDDNVSYVDDDVDDNAHQYIEKRNLGTISEYETKSLSAGSSLSKTVMLSPFFCRLFCLV